MEETYSRDLIIVNILLNNQYKALSSVAGPHNNGSINISSCC